MSIEEGAREGPAWNALKLMSRLTFSSDIWVTDVNLPFNSGRAVPGTDPELNFGLSDPRSQSERQKRDPDKRDRDH